jgi:hypothetical protein
MVHDCTKDSHMIVGCHRETGLLMIAIEVYEQMFGCWTIINLCLTVCEGSQGG